MFEFQPTDLLIYSTIRLGTKEHCESTNKGKNQRLRANSYTYHTTRPNIGYSVNMVSQFINNLNEEYIEATYSIMRYLKLTPAKGLSFKKSTSS